MPSIIAPPCHAHYPTSHWRTCPDCAARRQARIADTAARILADYPDLSLTVIKPAPGTSTPISTLRINYLRAAAIPAGLWTIERGPVAGTLHANILAPAHTPPSTRNAITHQSPLWTDPRTVAAYISKPSQYPPPGTYTGRLYGSWRRLADILVDPDTPPVVQAALLNAALLPPSSPPPPPPPDRPPHQWPDLYPDPPDTDYKAIAAKYLANLNRYRIL